ncbi:Uncharacterized conserved protein YcbK, DUF882 family [Desulfacinum hydrothermale DSM 13146]|uniref:Murein endopeptidase K n=1 Tax=Desulfacinum hydrothermale DSM 13146 TaxID=1121390 RepID=A0A1W1WYV9_9BACT|nr:DUF882 domain-containing protein [Desulfacinum hydrothermale]SMC16817.1 Uncharacterized conserved protein YcbK, DUF882 family [Desulfacinum hydrothermale DSM 13146]
MTRRQFFQNILAGGCATAAILLGCDPAQAAPFRGACCGRLSFYNLHTRESLSVRYMGAGGRLDPRALRRLDHLFRCHYTGEVRRIDRRLYMLLDALRSRLGLEEKPYLLVSGYRSPVYNALLRKQGHGVAKKSYHLRGMAADIRMEGVPLAVLRKTAAGFRAGGIGSYPDFIHLDVGPVRYW